jgi:t-SNARE complex subunit (syntaxin)
MEKFNYLIDASFNLLKASEENEANLRKAIKNLDANTNILKNNVQNIDSNVRDTVNSSSKDAAASISRKILLDLNNANEMANSAAERYERAARFSIVN